MTKNQKKTATTKSPVGSQQLHIKELYNKVIVPNMQKKFGIKNVLAVPRIMKVVVSMGLGKFSRENKTIESARADLSQVTCQLPKICIARKSISEFGIRSGMPAGIMVTLRGAMMYNFLYRLINIALPRIRDFRGFRTKSFDGLGNFNIGIIDQSIFPEIDLDSPTNNFGFNITIVTNTTNAEQAQELISAIGFPFVKQ